MTKPLTLLLLISISILGCDPKSLQRDPSKGKSPEPKNEKKRIKVSETEKPKTSAREDAGDFFFKNAKGETIQKNELRDPGLIAKKMNFTIRHVGAYEPDFHFDSKGKTQLMISNHQDGVFVNILGDDLSIQNDVKVGMHFGALMKAYPKLKCLANDDAAGYFVQCDLAKFAAIFPAKPKEIAALTSRSKLDVLEKMLGTTKLSRLERSVKAVPKPKNATAQMRQKGVLPSGVSYFRNGYTPCKNTKWSSKTCDVPTVAVVDGIYTAEKARQRLNSIGVGAQYPVGYPLVVHSDEIGFKDTKAKGVTIVLGLFANGNAAKTWQLKVAPKSKIMTLLPPGKLRESNTKQVVRIRPGASAMGYKDTPFKKDSDMMNPPDKMPEGFCKVAAGSFVVVSDDSGYAATPKPAKCKNGKNAFVHHKDTLLHTMIGPDRESKWKAWQLTYVECDAGYFASWPMDGRNVGSKRTVLENDGGC